MVSCWECIGKWYLINGLFGADSMCGSDRELVKLLGVMEAKATEQRNRLFRLNSDMELWYIKVRVADWVRDID